MALILQGRGKLIFQLLADFGVHVGSMYVNPFCGEFGIIPNWGPKTGWLKHAKTCGPFGPCNSIHICLKSQRHVSSN